MTKTILLTGATGFLGSHICDQLVEQGYETVILKRKTSNAWRIESILDRIIVYNIGEGSLKKIFRENEIKTVIHTATSYGKMGEKSHEVATTNVIFPLKIIETAIDFNVDTFINTDTILNKYFNYYSLTKKHFLDWAKTFSSQIGIFNLKLEHLYGEKDEPEKFISMVIRNFLKNVDRIPLTEGKQLRDFIYVDDAVSAYLEILKISNTHRNGYVEYSIGSGTPISIREIVELIKKLTHNTTTVPNFGVLEYRPNEIMKSVADLKNIENDTQWKPKYDLKSGLEKTIQWHKKHI